VRRLHSLSLFQLGHNEPLLMGFRRDSAARVHWRRNWIFPRLRLLVRSAFRHHHQIAAAPTRSEIQQAIPSRMACMTFSSCWSDDPENRRALRTACGGFVSRLCHEAGSHCGSSIRGTRRYPVTKPSRAAEGNENMCGLRARVSFLSKDSRRRSSFRKMV
jgi:hypothetical protein